MKNLKKSFDYVQDMMANKMETMEMSIFKEPTQKIESYLNGNEHRGVVGMNFDYLSIWYLWKFNYSFTANNKVEYDLLAQSTYYGVAANKWEYSIGQSSEHYDGAPLFITSSMHLSQLVLLGQIDESLEYCSLLMKMLNGKQSEMFPFTPTYPWFIFDLYLRSNGAKIQPSWKNYPHNMGIYGEALKNWNTSDNALFENLLVQLCDFHIAQSDEYEHHGNLLEFSEAKYFIFPAEILVWLRLRQKIGLYIGDNNLHPLLKLEINQLPTTIHNFRKDEKVTKCFEKLHKDYPAIKFEYSE